MAKVIRRKSPYWFEYEHFLDKLGDESSDFTKTDKRALRQFFCS